ncbi:hypothetical protein MYP_2317 [Sporocytophaga myxococcoides]|uniref:Uncharacterized protein n=1 Tax=Sporocytophaga myxococcoides TaxID=153721 RepID=A0A098LF64_9BACT|nr:hypothetical protein [Sporocytophaga myxococcoides]GAL85089.1 hypothetical protein MYP_2317 [Sporocytophaga myxococcoides]
MKKQWGVLLMFMVMFSVVSAQETESYKSGGPVKDLCVKRITQVKDSINTSLQNVAYLSSKKISSNIRYDFEAELQQNLDAKNIYYKDTSTDYVEEVKKLKMLQWPFQKRRGEREGSARRVRYERRGHGEAGRDMQVDEEVCI